MTRHLDGEAVTYLLLVVAGGALILAVGGIWWLLACCAFALLCMSVSLYVFANYVGVEDDEEVDDE